MDKVLPELNRAAENEYEKIMAKHLDAARLRAQAKGVEWTETLEGAVRKRLSDRLSEIRKRHHEPESQPTNEPQPTTELAADDLVDDSPEPEHSQPEQEEFSFDEKPGRMLDEVPQNGKWRIYTAAAKNDGHYGIVVPEDQQHAMSDQDQARDSYYIDDVLYTKFVGTEKTKMIDGRMVEVDNPVGRGGHFDQGIAEYLYFEPQPNGMMRMAYIIPKVQNWAPPGGVRGGQLFVLEIDIPEDLAVDVEEQVRTHPWFIRRLVERISVETFSSREWKKQKPPWAKWDRESFGGKLYLAKSTDDTGFNEHNVITVTAPFSLPDEFRPSREPVQESPQPFPAAIPPQAAKPETQQRAVETAPSADEKPPGSSITRAEIKQVGEYLEQRWFNIQNNFQRSALSRTMAFDSDFTPRYGLSKSRTDEFLEYFRKRSIKHIPTTMSSFLPFPTDDDARVSSIAFRHEVLSNPDIAVGFRELNRIFTHMEKTIAKPEDQDRKALTEAINTAARAAAERQKQRKTEKPNIFKPRSLDDIIGEAAQVIERDGTYIAHIDGDEGLESLFNSIIRDVMQRFDGWELQSGLEVTITNGTLAVAGPLTISGTVNLKFETDALFINSPQKGNLRLKEFILRGKNMVSRVTGKGVKPRIENAMGDIAGQLREVLQKEPRLYNVDIRDVSLHIGKTHLEFRIN